MLGWVIVAGAAAVAATVLGPLRPAQTDSPVAAKAPRGKDAPPADSSLAELPAREAMGKPRGELFGPPPVPAAAPRAAAARPQPPKPVAPPMPYRVAGQVMHDGAVHVVLANGDRVMMVRVGQVLDETYRVEAISPDGVWLVYLPLQLREEVPVAGMKLDMPEVRQAVAAAPAAPAEPAAAAEARPAQLRWVGPERVQAGANFNVALKLTSEQPVVASPMQLSFDAKLLEPVSVRAGGFFADGSFTYRVNPGGSIFVGAASGAGGVAADADFLVVTFRPIRSGAAELKVSSVVLQGAAGRAILHEPPAAFRTIVQ
jgi:cohesin domain-containing protein